MKTETPCTVTLTCRVPRQLVFELRCELKVVTHPEELESDQPCVYVPDAAEDGGLAGLLEYLNRASVLGLVSSRVCESVGVVDQQGPRSCRGRGPAAELLGSALTLMRASQSIFCSSDSHLAVLEGLRGKK